MNLLQHITMVNGLFKIIGCFVLLLLCCCFGTIAILLFRPDFVWDKIADNIADETLVVDFDGSDIIEVSSRLNSQLTGVGENTIVVSESDLNVLIKERSNNPNIFLDLADDQAKVLYKIDDHPVYAYAALNIKENKINIEETGIGKIRLPNFVSGIANDMLRKFASELKLDTILTQTGEGILVKGIDIDDSKLTIQVIFSPQVF
jgi:hypothetical protein